MRVEPDVEDDDVPTVEPDCPCRGCGYNLRGLRFDGNCPECASPVSRTLVLIADLRETVRDVVDRKRRRQVAPVAERAGISVDAALFVWDAWSFAHKHGVSPSTAADVCEVVKDHVLNYFHDEDEARDLLTEWGLCRSEDVGRIIFACVELGWLVAEPHESVRDFDGLFTLDTLFSDEDW